MTQQYIFATRREGLTLKQVDDSILALFLLPVDIKTGQLQICRCAFDPGLVIQSQVAFISFEQSCGKTYITFPLGPMKKCMQSPQTSHTLIPVSFSYYNAVSAYVDCHSFLPVLLSTVDASLHEAAPCCFCQIVSVQSHSFQNKPLTF